MDYELASQELDNLVTKHGGYYTLHSFGSEKVTDSIIVRFGNFKKYVQREVKTFSEAVSLAQKYFNKWASEKTN